MPTNPDVSLADEQPGQQHAGHEHDFGDTPFGNPNGSTPAAAPVMKYLSLDEVLTSAKRHRTAAHICLRADLQAEYDEILAELASMVDSEGNLLPREKDASLNDGDLAGLAQEKSDRLVEIRREMNAAMRRVEFEGMAEDKWRPWYDKHYPKGKDPDLTDFNNLLIAEVAVNPTLTVAEIVQLRSVLGAPQITQLANKAWIACTRGGVDIPKSPAFLRNPRQS